MQIDILQKAGSLTQFEIHFNNDEVPYRIWSIDERHAIQEATAIAITTNIISSSIALHINSVYE